jgi:hypothetical protein
MDFGGMKVSASPPHCGGHQGQLKRPSSKGRADGGRRGWAWRGWSGAGGTPSVLGTVGAPRREGASDNFSPRALGGHRCLTTH